MQISQEVIVTLSAVEANLSLFERNISRLGEQHVLTNDTVSAMHVLLISCRQLHEAVSALARDVQQAR